MRNEADDTNNNNPYTVHNSYNYNKRSSHERSVIINTLSLICCLLLTALRVQMKNLMHNRILVFFIVSDTFNRVIYTNI